MNTNIMLLIILIVMVAAAVLTIRVGTSLGNKDANGSYFANTGRKLGRLLAIYGVVIIAALAIFVAVLRS
ncbi:hypothetical protein [Cohnella terricola]|uniref:Protein-export membrane protein SecG n=1 Tax=Cohnella terricola TaxID=1289167 RepID=A0A559J601_9BACL|nr:hypothetical protein [Cohnella terricola]TVX95303.1 hypothetical protein FPZ45_23655 [Cohnella terricola]